MLIVCFLGVAIFYFFRPPAEDDVLVSVESYKEQSELFSIQAEYPQFPRLPKEFNERVRSRVFEEISQFKASVRENNETASTGKYRGNNDMFLEVGWLHSQLNARIVSISLQFSSYIGGAHGAHYVATFNYDVIHKKEITLDILFSGVENYLERISQFSLNDLKNQMGSDANIDMIRTGTSPKTENFSLFTLENSDTIVFHFLEYQVAPYVAGKWSVSMPISYLKLK